MFRNEARRASIIRFAVFALAMGLVWHHFSDRVATLEKRLEKVENEARILSPLSNVFKGLQPGKPVPHAYQAIQATGPPDVSEPSDSPFAWCAEAEDRGLEWLELEFNPPVAAGEVKILASFNPGAVSRVTAATTPGEALELWAGVSSADAVQSIPVSPPVMISKLKIELDTSRVPGWNQIDAVALVDAAGVPHWATGATGSSEWKGE